MNLQLCEFVDLERTVWHWGGGGGQCLGRQGKSRAKFIVLVRTGRRVKRLPLILSFQLTMYNIGFSFLLRC